MTEAIYWYACPECEKIWASDNDYPNREWCVYCSSADEPEFLYEEAIQL